MSADTRRIESIGSFGDEDDTICTPAHDETSDPTPQPPRPFFLESDESLPIRTLAPEVIRLLPLESSPFASKTNTESTTRARWPARMTTPLVAVAAFTAGALFTSFSDRHSEGLATGLPAAPVEAARSAELPPSPAASSPSRSDVDQREEAAATPKLPDVTARSMPSMGEVRGEIERATGAVRRCARRADRVDVEIAFEGATGHVSEAVVRTTTLRKDRASCVVRVLHSLAVAPFASGEFRVNHRFGS